MASSDLSHASIAYWDDEQLLQHVCTGAEGRFMWVCPVCGCFPDPPHLESEVEAAEDLRKHASEKNLEELKEPPICPTVISSAFVTKAGESAERRPTSMAEVSGTEPSREQLHAFAREHLLYEMTQLREIRDELLALRAHDRAVGRWDLDHLSVWTRNAQVESFAIHARALHDFFYEAPQQDDVSARHYVAGEWQPPPKTPSLELVKQKVNKEIAHMTLHRVKVSEEAKQWSYDQIWRDFAAVLRTFADAASPERLPEEVRETIRELAVPEPEHSARDLGRLSALAATDYPSSWLQPTDDPSIFIQSPENEAQPGTATYFPPPGHRTSSKSQRLCSLSGMGRVSVVTTSPSPIQSGLAVIQTVEPKQLPEVEARRVE